MSFSTYVDEPPQWRGAEAPINDFTPPPNRERVWVFASVFLLAAAISLSYTFLRPPEYRASARLQITPASARPAADEALTGNSDNSQSFLTEVQALTSRPILQQAVDRLQTAGRLPETMAVDTLDRVQAMLRVSPVDGTKLALLQAEGRDKEFLPQLVNTVVEVYRENLLASYQSFSANSLADARQEVELLNEKAKAKRQAVEAFRTDNDIVSIERDENRVLSKLKGLTNSLNLANDRVAIAEGRVLALKNSMVAGKAVVRAKDDPTIANMEQRVSQTREELRGLEQRFTTAYLGLDPQVQSLRNRLRDLQQQVETQREASRQAAFSEAQEELASAREAARRLQTQLGGDRQAVQAFSTRFNEYKSLTEELSQLQVVHRAAQDRLAKLEASERARTPQLRIIESATTPREPWRPLYGRDAAISVALSLVLAIFAVWLLEYLTRRERNAPVFVPTPWITLPVTRQATAARSLPANDFVQLPPTAPPLRELNDGEIGALLQAAGAEAKVPLLLFLSGLTVDEVSALRGAHVDLVNATLSVPGPASRKLPLRPPLLTLLTARATAGAEQPLLRTADDAITAVPNAANLQAAVTYAAYDAGLESPQEVTPEALRHTYLGFLVRQGVRFAELGRIAGHVPATELAGLQNFAPPGARVGIEAIDPVMPALRSLQIHSQA